MSQRPVSYISFEITLHVRSCLYEYFPVKEPEPVEDLRPPSKLPPLSLDTAWETPALDTAWKSGNTCF